MTYIAHHPDGRSETLLLIPNYNFDWQMPYRWAPGAKKLPKGTRLECIVHYDNSITVFRRTGKETFATLVYWFDARGFLTALEAFLGGC